MDDEAESSHAGLRHVDSPSSDADPEQELAVEDAEEDAKRREQRAKERRLDAKRKRVVFLDHLLRELDTLVFLELITIYHLDCSFFWFAVRTVVHITLLTPLPDLQLARQHDEQKPFLPLILLLFAANFLLHALSKAPSAGEETRGYLHGGLMIDFIGQQGPTGRWKLAGLDTCILMLQLVMVSVHVKRRELKKRLAKISGGTPGTTPTGGEEAPDTEDDHVEGQAGADREQDADAEERGMLRRSDTLSDAGADPDEDALLSSASDSGHADALDSLSSGQAVIGDFTLVDTLLQEHENYQTYRQTRSEAGSSTSLSPDTLRQLHNFRMRFGVGGG